MQYYTALVVLAAAASVEAAASQSERLQWYFPFKYQTCTGCRPTGNLLPWCVKVPASNVVCPIGSKAGSVSLPCVRAGVASAAITAGTANALSAAGAAKLSIAGSQITCADGAIDGSCIQLTADSFPADFVIPDTTTIGASQVTCSAESPISTACLGAISSGITISGTQVTSAVANATYAGTAGTAGTAAGLTCPTSNSVIPSCYSFNGTLSGTVSVPAGQVAGNLTNANISPANVCLPGQTTTALGACASVAGSQITGTIGSGVGFNGTVQGATACASVATCVKSTLFTLPANLACGAGVSTVVSCVVAGLINCNTLPPPSGVSCSDSSALTAARTDADTCTWTCGTASAMVCASVPATQSNVCMG